MPYPFQSRIPSSKHHIPTPALILDLDSFEHNLAKMAAHLQQHRVELRPHAKTHKCPTIAKRQIAMGARGICVAKLSEAEVMTSAGVEDVLITSQIVGKAKIENLIRLAAQCPGLTAVVDHPAVAQDLIQATEAEKTPLNLLIDVDGGNHRTGCRPGRPALELAEMISNSRWLKLSGLQCYAGHASHVMGFEARKRSSEEALARALESKALIERNGIPVEGLTGGSTGTYNVDVRIEGFTELQAGSYIFMDLDYRRVGGNGNAQFLDFEYALSVLCTVISKSHSDLATVDAGFKAFSTDKPFVPELEDIPGVNFRWAGDEHGILELMESGHKIQLGSRLEFIPPHCDTTVNLYDFIYAVRGDRVEEVWPVEARGKSQ
jgi:3-hydroxy-D-aspartate aldolase